MSTPPIRNVIGLPPGDTVRAFEARGDMRATVRWHEMWQEDHARAFTVAKVANLDLLAEIQSSIADVLANGGTFEQWKANLLPHLVRTGWYGEVADRALTGTDETVQVGARRLRTIYDTNLRVSRAAGRWKRIQEMKDVRPFLRYTAVMDTRTRPEHRRWHGVILPVDHPWWDTHFPPCGWFCRCTARQLSQRDLDSKGWKVTPVPDDGPPVPFKPAGRDTVVQVPRGISPGFDYNPGAASLRAIAGRAVRSVERTAGTDVAVARSAVDDLVASDAFREFLKEEGGAFPIGVLDPDGVGLLQAPSSTVVLPKGVLRKQDREHGELELDDYRVLPRLIADPLVVVEQPADGAVAKAVFYALRDGDKVRYYRAVIRTDPGEPHAIVVSFHVVRPRDIAATIKTGRLILDRRGPR